MSTTIWKRTGAFVMIGSMLAVNASAVAQQKPQDPDHPYAGSVTGMFHDQTAGENLGEYSVYLPSTIEQCVTGDDRCPGGYDGESIYAVVVGTGLAGRQ